MQNIYEILARAAALRDETQLNSISPERAGGIMYDTLLALNDLWLQQGGALVISKIYASVAAMEADTAPVSDLTGQPLRPGQIVVIASSDSDNGSVYRYNGTDSPSWSLVGEIGNLEPVDSLDSDSTQLPLAAHQGKVLDGKISQLGQYVDNPEFVEVHTDEEGKVLYGVKKDGDFHFGAGVPSQVDAAIDEKLEEGLETKVDKEDDMSLIDADYAASKSTIENPEYLEVTTDSEDKVLEGIKTDGTKVIGGDLNVGGSAKILGNMEVSGVSYKVVENPEYLAAWVDAEDKVVFGLKTDGKTFVGDADFLNDIEDIKAFLANLNDKDIDWDALTSITAVDNPEYLELTTDSEGKILAGRTTDGAAFENVGYTTPKLSVDGATMENIEDLEGRTEILTDSEGKIISYRDSNGVKHEEVGIETGSATVNHLNLTGTGMTEFQQALKDAGFKPGGTGDWSDYISNDGDNPLCIPEPRCAKVNIISDFDLTQLSKEGRAGAQKGINYEIPTQIEFWDMQGNYFKKWALMSGQGASTMARPKKNIALDLFDEEADGDAFKIKFGEWIAMDSFHLKAYALSNIKAKPVIVYRLNKEILDTRGVINNYTWKNGLVNLGSVTPQDAGISSKSAWENQFDNGATCFPDGFPCVVYQNGEFFGIYMWQIKKARDNYKMNKKTAKHIHLDGELFDIFSYDGNIDWDVFAGNKADSIGVTGDVEIRNPKDLYLMDGTKYNADTNRGEIMDSSSSYYDSSNANHVRSNNVKTYLLALSRTTSIINAAKEVYEASEKTASDLATFKAVFETYFDKDNLIDYLVISDVILNWDGFNHNAQWTTWDGVKWFINMYDVDNTFGGGQYGAPTNYHIIYRGAYTRLPMFLILLDYYLDDIHDRYSELRNLGILSSDHICDLMTKMQNAVGSEYYLMDFEKWSAVDPLLTENDFDSIYRIKKFLDVQINNMDVLYNYEQ